MGVTSVNERLEVGTAYQLALKGNNGTETFIHLDYITYQGQEYALACGTGKYKNCLFAFIVSVVDGAQCLDSTADATIKDKLGRWYVAQYSKGSSARSITQSPTPLPGTATLFRLLVDNANVIVDYICDVEVDFRFFSLFLWQRPFDKMEPHELILSTIFAAERAMEGAREVWEPVDNDDLSAAIEKLGELSEEGDLPSNEPDTYEA